MPAPAAAGITLSFGRANKFEQCPALYAASYLDRVPEIPSFPLEAGKRAHAFLDKYLAYLERHEIPDDPSVVDSMVRAAFVDDPEAINTDTFRDVLIVARVFARHYRHDYEATIGREEWLERYMDVDDLVHDELARVGAELGIPIEGAAMKSTRWTGRYDRLYVKGEIGSGDETFWVRDYKTGWDAELSTSNIFQGEVYVWMLTEKYPAMAGRLGHEVYFVRHNRIKPSKLLTTRDLEDVEKRLRVIRARIFGAHLRDRFPATPGWHCGFCPVSPNCAKRNALVNVGALIDDEASAIVALGETIVLEGALEKRRRQLRDYAKRAAPIALPDGTVAGYGTKESIVVRDVDAFVEALGLDAAIPFLSINNRAAGVKKLQDDPAFSHLFGPERKSRFEIANRAALSLPAGIGGEGDGELELGDGGDDGGN